MKCGRWTLWEQIIWEWVIWEWEDIGGGGNAYMGRGPLAETLCTIQSVRIKDSKLYKIRCVKNVEGANDML